MSDRKCACNLPHPRGADHPEFKGDEASYSAFHYRVRTARGKADCCTIPRCTSDGPFHWANLTGNYGDVMDYRKMCRTHHDEFDRPWEKRRGELTRSAKLTEQSVRAIRAASGVSDVSLARQYGIGRTQVGRIRRRESWGWLE